MARQVGHSGGFTPWHQDQFYWPLDTDRTITMWMPLVDVTDPRQAPRVDAAIQEAFNVSIANMMSSRLAGGVDGFGE